MDRVLEVEPDFLDSDHDHEHDDDVTSVSFVSDTPLDLDKFETWVWRPSSHKRPRHLAFKRNHRIFGR